MKFDDVGEAFGALVRAEREARQWTQAELAQRLGGALGRDVNSLVVTRIESGKRPVPLPEVAALAHLLNLEIDPLVNPSAPKLTPAEASERAKHLQEEINSAFQEEVRLMGAQAAAKQQLTNVRIRKGELERELQAVERVINREG